MMVPFSGRDANTIRMKNKPVSEGFKIFALCDHGYTYDTLPTSRIHQNEEVKIVNGINYTGSIVLHLALKLPYRRKTFNIFMDNYFSSIPLFSYLRNKNIGACGTVRTNSKKFPEELKALTKEKKRWGFRSGMVVDDVLAVVWMDAVPVTALTTIHDIKGDAWQIERDRKKPRITLPNAERVRETFGDNHRQLLKIPVMINDYNHHMGGVDIADQLRGYYTTQLTSRRTWMPLFFWLLDTVLVNCHLLSKLKGGIHSQVEFRQELLWSLIRIAKEKEETAIPTQPNPRQARITKNFTTNDLPAARLQLGNHFPIYNTQRKTCVWCSLKCKDGDKKGHVVSESQFSCELCNVYLCLNKNRNCFKAFHSLDR